MSDTESEVTAESLMATLRQEDAARPDTETAPAAPEKPKDAPQPKEPAEKPVAKEPEPDASKTNKTEPAKNDAEKPKSKWAQNADRQSKSWEQINADKAAVAAERAELQRQKEAFEQSRVTSQELRDEHGATSKDYRDAAKQFKAKGDSAMADAAEKLAANLDTKENTLRQEQVHKQGAAKWQQNLADLTVKHPDLAKPDSPLSLAAVNVLKAFPMLSRDPDGIKYAVRAAEIELQAKSFDGTKSELEKLKADHAALQKKLTISGGSPTAPVPEDKSFKDLSQKDARRHLEQAAEQFDRESNL